MSVKVFKFGGASVRDAEGFRNVGSILKKYSDDNVRKIINAVLDKIIKDR